MDRKRNFLSDISNYGESNLSQASSSSTEWPKHGIRVVLDCNERIEYCRQLYKFFKEVKKELDSYLSPPSSPEDGPSTTYTRPNSRALDTICQGVLLVSTLMQQVKIMSFNHSIAFDQIYRTTMLNNSTIVCECAVFICCK